MIFVRLGLLVLVVATTVAGPAAAQPSAAAQPPASGSPAAEPSPELVARARAHFEAGNAHYAAGRYEEAIQEFQAGHALVPRPSFLLNLGQAYRKVGDLARAKEAYLAYLRSLPEGSPLRDQALQVLAEVEVQIRESAHAGTATALDPRPPPGTVIAAAPPSVTPPPPAPAEPPPPNHTGRWLALGLGATAVALGAVGAVYEVRAKRASDQLSELDRQRRPYDPAKARAGRRDEVVGVVLISAGGAALLAGLGVLLFGDGGAAPEPREHAVARSTIVPLVDGHGAGLVLGGRF